MFTKTSLAAIPSVIIALGSAAVARADNTKYTFNDVEIDDRIVEIEAGVKSTKKNDVSDCTYFSDNYATFLGYYEDDVFAGATADEVLQFCIENFDERIE